MQVIPLYKSAIVDTLINLNEHQPLSVIIEAGEKKYTVSELYKNAFALAKGMALNGVVKGSKIVIAMPPGFLFVSYLIAGSMNGATIVLIDPEMGRDNYNSKLKQIKPDFAVLDKRLMMLQEHPLLLYLSRFLKASVPYFPHVKGIIYFSDNQKLPVLKQYKSARQLFQQGTSQKAEWTSINENDDAFVVYTSGTLTEPKGVLHSFGSFNSSIEELSRQFNMKGLRIGASLPHFVFLALACQATAVIMNPFKDENLRYKFLLEKKIAVLFGPPSDYTKLIDHCRSKNIFLPSFLQHLLIGSAPVHPPFLKNLVAVSHPATTITCVYGMTEHLLIAIADGRKKAEDISTHDLLGNFVQHVDYKIATDGELLIKGQQLFKHYLGNNSNNEYHETGDLVKMDNNLLYLTGRKKNMIIRRNFNIYPELYEHTIMKIGGVNEALMIGIYSEELHDEKIVLVIDGIIKQEKLMRLLRNGAYSIDKEALPDEIIFAAIPHGGRQNKADRNMARKHFKSFIK